MISPRARLHLLHILSQQIPPRVINRAELSNLTWSHIAIALQGRSSESSALPLARLLNALANLCEWFAHAIARKPFRNRLAAPRREYQSGRGADR